MARSKRSAVEQYHDRVAPRYDHSYDETRGIADPGKRPGLARHYPDYTWSARKGMYPWGVMRCLDYLETLDFIDMDRIVVHEQHCHAVAMAIAALYDERIDALLDAQSMSPYAHRGNYVSTWPICSSNHCVRP